MSTLASTVRVAVSGELSVAPVGTTAPTTSTIALNASFVGLGFVSDDGVTLTPKDTVQQIRAWQYAALVRTIRKEREWTIKCKLIEDKGAVAKLYYSNTSITTQAADWYITPDGTIPDPRAFVFDVLDGSVHKRIYVPNGEVTERGETVFSSGDAIMYDLTITCYWDAGLSAPFKIFTDNTAWGYS